MLSHPGFVRGSPAQILMRTNLVVPPLKGCQLLVQLHGIVNQDLPDLHFKGPKEPLDPAILPGAMGIGCLVADAQQPKPEPEQPAGENGFVVGVMLPPALCALQTQKSAGTRWCSGFWQHNIHSE